MNRKRPLLRQGGVQAKLGLEVMKMTAGMQLGISSMDKGTDALLGSTGLIYAVKKRVREVLDEGIGQDAACNLVKRLEECGEATADGTTMGRRDTPDSTPAITSERDGRLRPFRVDSFEVPMPSNERWYQHHEAVKLFLRLQKQGAKLKVVYKECARRDLMTVNYPVLMKKLDKVKVGMARGFTLDEVLAQRIRQRPSKEKRARTGPIDFMTESQFKDAVRKRTVHDRAVSSADHKEILSAAKKERMLMRGMDAGSTHDVANCTVAEYEKCLGGEDLQIREQVSHRSHARVQAAQSIMHLFTYIFTTICSHIMVADDGVGEDPPHDDWGLLRAVRDQDERERTCLSCDSTLTTECLRVRRCLLHKASILKQPRRLAPSCSRTPSTKQSRTLSLPSLCRYQYPSEIWFSDSYSRQSHFKSLLPKRKT